MRCLDSHYRDRPYYRLLSSIILVHSDDRRPTLGSKGPQIPSGRAKVGLGWVKELSHGSSVTQCWGMVINDLHMTVRKEQHNWAEK